MKTILVTGGTGFIGSHTSVELINAGYEVIIVDSLVNSKLLVLDRIERITGVRPIFYLADLRDEEKVKAIFQSHKIDAVIHFAGLKAVGESVEKPELYYDNNIGSSKVLLKVMREFGVKNIVFSSSATVYGVPDRVPLYESDPIKKATNPYGQTKIEIEKLLQAAFKEDKDMNIVILRYFNPIGAHPSGLMGEDPNDIPNNLMPYITQVAIGKRKHLNVFGNDYMTPDGTGVRDYIHVVDLAKGHLASLKVLKDKLGLKIYNLGTGKGTSVLDLVKAFEKVNGIKIPYVIGPRRDGDIDENYANCDNALIDIGWKASLTIEDCCRDAWNWQKHNPHGY
ncbi:MAG: UDP-glucose 4-epimerase GalE [Bacilli bacterium]|nr:UDP-glucose 4-epimerase GalE [Bacilli bacterium]